MKFSRFAFHLTEYTWAGVAGNLKSGYSTRIKSDDFKHGEVFLP